MKDCKEIKLFINLHLLSRSLPYKDLFNNYIWDDGSDLFDSLDEINFCRFDY